MSDRPRVVYWNNQPTPYLTARLNAVVDAGEVDVEAWFDVEREVDRSWDFDPADWKFPATVLPKVRIGRRTVPFPDRDLLATPIDVLVTPMDRIPGAIAAVVGRACARRVASRTLPIFETWVKKQLRSEVAYRFLYRSIDGAKTSGEQATALCEHYGLPRSRIWTVTQAIDLDVYGKARKIDAGEVAKLRRKLGVRGCTFIYVGRLWNGKGVNYLIDAFRELSHTGVDASLIILGDGQDEASIRTQASGMEGVHFGGFIQPDDLPPWYAAADVFVFPTLGDPNGLVVEEAMAAGLPVISTENAGDIRSRVLEGETGYVVPAFDAHALSEKMRIIALDEPLRRRMSLNAMEQAERFSVESYATDFNRFIKGVMADPARSTASARISRLAGRTLLSIARRA